MPVDNYDLETGSLSRIPSMKYVLENDCECQCLLKNLTRASWWEYKGNIYIETTLMDTLNISLDETEPDEYLSEYSRAAVQWIPTSLKRWNSVDGFYHA